MTVEKYDSAVHENLFAKTKYDSAISDNREN